MMYFTLEFILAAGAKIGYKEIELNTLQMRK